MDKLELLASVEQLQAQLKEAEEVIAFYGDKENWSSPFGFDNEFYPCIKLDDVQITSNNKNERGGKKAREYLAKYESEK